MQNKNTNKIIIPVVILVAVLIVAGVAYFLLKGDSDDKSSDDKSSKEASSMVADEKDKDSKAGYEEVVEDYMDAFVKEDADEMATMASDLLEDIYQKYNPYADEMTLSEFYEEQFEYDLDYAFDYFDEEFEYEDYDVSYEIVEIKDISEDELEEWEDSMAEGLSNDELSEFIDNISDAKIATVDIIAQSDDNDESLEYTIMLDKFSGSWKVFSSSFDD